MLLNVVGIFTNFLYRYFYPLQVFFEKVGIFANLFENYLGARGIILF